MDDESDDTSSNRRGKHPKHLRGKAIGLFYCNRQKERNMVHSVKALDSLNLSSEKLKLIASLISEPKTENYKSSDGTYDHIGDSIFKRKFLHTIQSSIQENPGLISSISRNETLDEQFHMELNDKIESSQKYRIMLKQRQRLPAFDRREQILDLVERNQVVLISGETGCGKTTQVAQFILDKYIEEKNGSLCKIVCTQPRRISAISIADRVADERAERLGMSVGYHIRLERVMPRPHGSVVFCTTGMLLKQMETDPFLVEYSHLILDEIHERDIMSDFLLTLIKQVITKRKDLKLILMSATLNSEKFSDYFGGCEHINIPGFTFPVEEYYLEDVLELTDFSFGENREEHFGRDRYAKNYRGRRADPKNKEFYDYIVPHINNLSAERKYKRTVIKELLNPESEKLNYDLILCLLDKICQETDPSGAILVFLTGYSEIQTLYCQLTEDYISKFPKNKYLVLPLHSQMSTVNQKEIFNRPPEGVRKIVLSTNIAETSITIDDIVYVIDTGRIKIKNYNTETNTQTLLPEWVSLANASQRKGRAGRVQPGICYHLFSSARKLLLENYQKPEILRTRLEEVILMTKLLRLGKVEHFFESLIDKPSAAAVEVSLDLLKRLNALDDDENLTPLGYHLAKLPMNPQLGKMLLLGAIFSCLDPILSVVVTLDYKDPFLLPMGKEREADYKRSILAEDCLSDHLFYHKILKLFDSVHDRRKFCWDNFLSMQTLNSLRDLKKQFMGYLYDLNFVPNTNPECKECNVNSGNYGLLKAIICAGLYPNVFCSMDHKKGRNILRNLKGKKVELHPKSVLAKRPLSKSVLVYYLQVRSTAVFIYDATVISPIPLIFFGDKHRFEKSDNRKFILINDDLKFAYRDDVVDVVMRLREKLNWFLEHKISHPGVVDWSKETEEVRVLRAVMELVTAEEEEEAEAACERRDDRGVGGYDGSDRRFGSGRRMDRNRGGGSGGFGRMRGQFRGRGKW